MAVTLIKNMEHYTRVLLEELASAEKFIWIATADIKDLYVKINRKRIPFLGLLSRLIGEGVEIRLIHAKEPGEFFRNDFDRYPVLAEELEMLLCPRIHFKAVIIDGVRAYLGSANLTGAGIGAKHPDKRNFEMGIFTDEPELVSGIADEFDYLWMGGYCQNCRRKEFCASHIEM